MHSRYIGVYTILRKANKWIPIQTAYVYTVICMPNLLRPVQFGQAPNEITDYSIPMQIIFQNHTILRATCPRPAR